MLTQPPTTELLQQLGWQTVFSRDDEEFKEDIHRERPWVLGQTA